MDYELALKLKDCGFPQGTSAFLTDPNCTELDSVGSHSHGDCEVYPPTLSELIEACGEKFVALTLYKAGEWIAQGENIDGQEGTIPEEAVARLYLALHTTN